MTAIPPTNEFFDSLSSDLILLYIFHLDRVTGHSKTLIDNIFSNHIPKETICGNLISVISDHLPQFLIMLSVFQSLLHPNPMSTKEVVQISIKKS